MQDLQPLPRSAFFVIAGMAVVLVGLVVLGGRFYLANWHGDIVFLPVVLLLGLLLVAAVFHRFFRKRLANALAARLPVQWLGAV